MLGIAREEQSNPVELKFFRGTTGANVVADATPDADRTLRLRSTVPHFSQYPYIGLGHSYKHSARPCTTCGELLLFYLGVSHGIWLCL